MAPPARPASGGAPLATLKRVVRKALLIEARRPEGAVHGLGHGLGGRGAPGDAVATVRNHASPSWACVPGTSGETRGPLQSLSFAENGRGRQVLLVSEAGTNFPINPVQPGPLPGTPEGMGCPGFHGAIGCG